MATVTGFVEKIKFRNEDNGYTVMSVSSEGEEYILVGTFQYIGEGEMIEAAGTMTEHPVYGEQLAVESYEIKAESAGECGAAIVICRSVCPGAQGAGLKIVSKGWTGGKMEKSAQPVIRRPAAEGFHCQGTGGRPVPDPGR